MNQSKYYITILFLSLVGFGEVSAQLNLKRQIPEKMKFEASKVIDSIYGITIYEPLNMQLSGDSIRMCSGYACQNWVEDVYTTGQLLHKGFYVDGQLKSYKNYYPNGNLEREYKSIDNYKSAAKLYYPSGKLKSDIKYTDGVADSWIDYNEEGQVIFEEMRDKSGAFLSYKKIYFDNGTPQQILEIVDKKQKTYNYTEYHKNGKISAQGQKIYSDVKFDYVYNGKWKFFDENGKLIKEEEYVKGEKVK